MSYEKAKSSFEAVIKKMQQDLQSYAASEKANQRAVDIRLDMINKLVAFYQQAEELISEMEMDMVGLQVQQSELHDTAQKLVYWCQLHGVDPVQPVFYTLEELEQLQIRGRKFRIVASGHYIDKFCTKEDFLSKDFELYLQDTKRYSETQFQCHLYNIKKSGF